MLSPDVLAQYPPAPLENWYRFNYFNNEYDISGSGVEDYSFAELRALSGLQLADLDQLVMHDTPTIGAAHLRQVLADRFAAGAAEKVMVTNGSNEALQLVVRSILHAGDEVITLGPCYHCHDKIAASFGCKVVRWELPIGTTETIDIAQLAQLITPKTRAVVLNFPHNPSGISIKQQELDEIVALIKSHDLYLIWDAAFQELVYDQPPLRDPIHDYAKAISVGTFSKAYGLPGLRFGWFIAAAEVIDAAVRQKDYGNLFVSPLIEVIAAKVIEHLDAFAQPRFKQAKHNRLLTDQWVKQHQDLVSWTLPQGGVCGLLRLPVGVDDVHFCNTLLARFGVLLVPGSCFGCSGFVRLGFGGNSSTLIEGLQRLALALRDPNFLISTQAA
jgi:capreomycidine synthase